MKVPSVIWVLNPESSAVKRLETFALNKEFEDVYVPSSCFVKPTKETKFEVSVVAPTLTVSFSLYAAYKKR